MYYSSYKDTCTYTLKCKLCCLCIHPRYFCFYFHVHAALLSCKPYHDLTTLRLFYFHIHSTFCYDCSPGYYQPLSNQTECLACPAGTYQLETNSTACTQCPAGKYSNLLARWIIPHDTLLKTTTMSSTQSNFLLFF